MGKQTLDWTVPGEDSLPAGAAKIQGNFDELYTMTTLATQSADPATPAAGLSMLYTKDVAGRALAGLIGPAGEKYPVQTFMGKHFVLYKPAAATTIGTIIGSVFTQGGTLSHPSITNASAILSHRRSRWANIVTTANQFLGVMDSTFGFWRGNAANLGGFFVHARFSLPLFPAGSRVFVGLSTKGNSTLIQSDPTSTATSLIGVGIEEADSDLSIIRKDGTTSVKAAFDTPQTRANDLWYDLYMFAPPNGSGIGVRVDKIDSSTGAITNVHNQTYTTNIPLATDMMNLYCTMSNGTLNTVVTTVAIELASLYAESDL